MAAVAHARYPGTEDVSRAKKLPRFAYKVAALRRDPAVDAEDVAQELALARWLAESKVAPEWVSLKAVSMVKSNSRAWMTKSRRRPSLVVDPDEVYQSIFTLPDDRDFRIDLKKMAADAGLSEALVVMEGVDWIQKEAVGDGVPLRQISRLLTVIREGYDDMSDKKKTKAPEKKPAKAPVKAKPAEVSEKPAKAAKSAEKPTKAAKPPTVVKSSEALNVIIAGANTKKMKPELVQAFGVDVLGAEFMAEKERSTSVIVREIGKFYAERETSLVECWDCRGKFALPAEDGTPCPYCGAAEDPPEGMVAADKPPTIKEIAALYSESDLDAAAARVNAQKAETAESFHKLGVELAQLHQTQIWRLRLGEDGKSKYSNFRQFVQEEFGFTGKWCENLMGIAKTYTIEQVREVGRSKLAILLRADPETQAKLLPQAADMSKRDLEAKVLKDANGEGAPKKKERVHEDTRIVTTMLPAGKTEIPLYDRSAEQVATVTFNDKSYGTFVTNNGVTIMYSFARNEAGELQLVMEPLRES
jgi:hypothetical protein